MSVDEASFKLLSLSAAWQILKLEKHQTFVISGHRYFSISLAILFLF
jgi:hypothetical protein